MSTHNIVQKLWSLCDILRDDWITYHQYVTELTLLLFLDLSEIKHMRVPASKLERTAEAGAPTRRARKRTPVHAPFA